MDQVHTQNDQFVQFLLHTYELLSSVLLSPSHTRIIETNQSRPKGECETCGRGAASANVLFISIAGVW